MCPCFENVFKFILGLCYAPEYTEYEKTKKDLVEPDVNDKPFIIDVTPSVKRFESDEICPETLEAPSSPAPNLLRKEAKEGDSDWDIMS